MRTKRGLGMFWIALAVPAVMLSFAPAASADEPAGDHIKVEVRGTLRTGQVAIGGESTGTTISASGATWDLAVKDAELQKLANSLNGKKAVVTGTLVVRRGVEIPKRWIVRVETLKAAE